MSRTSFTGPVSGAYDTWVFSFDDISANEDTNYRFRVPHDCVVLETSIQADTLTAGVNYSLNSTSGLIIAARGVPASDTNETLTPTSSPALTNRVLTKGDELTLLLDADGTGVVEGGLFSITVRVTGHVVADAVDD